MQCRYCGIRLSRRNRRIEHERLHLIDHSQQLYECSICGKTFNQKFGLYLVAIIEVFIKFELLQV